MMKSYTDRLDAFTYSVHHNPNCPSPFQVRLIGQRAGILDNLHLKTRDIRGYGKTLEEAAEDAWKKKFEPA